VGRFFAVLLLASALAGCSGQDKNGQPQAPTKTESRSSDPANEPYGRLSAAEYRAIVREYRELEPLQNGGADPQRLQDGRAACARLRRPTTELVVRVRADCNNALTFFAALTALENANSDCTQDTQRERLTCARDRYLAMAKAIRDTASDAERINQELRNRGITGLCARSIGITDSQLAAYRRAAVAARAGATAIAVGDSASFDQATRALSDALTSGSSNDPLRGIERGCQKAQPKPLPRVPDEGNGISA
jgi:hypothetical protein